MRLAEKRLIIIEVERGILIWVNMRCARRTQESVIKTEVEEDPITKKVSLAKLRERRKVCVKVRLVKAV